MAPQLRIRDATPDDARALASLYAAAFDDNPAYGSIFQMRGRSDAAHAASLTWFFERRVLLLLRARCPYLVAEEAAAPHRLVAAGAVVPTAQKPGLLDMLAVGLLEWPFRWGLPSLLRALAWADHVPPEAAASLAMVAVRPDAQGRGAGTALLSELLRRCGGGPVALSTQRERNLAFYGRAGFVVHSEWDGGGFPSWTMLRPRDDGGPAADAPATR